MHRLLSVSLVSALCSTYMLGGCYSPELGSTPFRCAPTGKRCPDDYQCLKNSSGIEVCAPGSSKPQRPDGLPPDPDGSVGNSKDGTVYVDGAVVKSSEQCKDREQEPNNSFSSAVDISGQLGLIPGWEICYDGDVDHYGVTLKEGQRLILRIEFKHSDGDLELVLLDPQGKVLDSSRSETNHELIERVITDAGLYVFAVYGYQGALAPYKIDLSIQ